jgi:hypothetical protein
MFNCRFSIVDLFLRSGDPAANRKCDIDAARTEQEKSVEAQTNYAEALCVLGLIDAGLGRKEEALREGRCAVELLPMEKDAVRGVFMIQYFAVIAAWIGDKDLPFEQLATPVRLPDSLSYVELKRNPFWDPLRGDPRFEKLLEESEKYVACRRCKRGRRKRPNTSDLQPECGRFATSLQIAFLSVFQQESLQFDPELLPTSEYSAALSNAASADHPLRV